MAVADIDVRAMAEPIQVVVHEIIGSARAVDAADGAKIYEIVLAALMNGQNVRLSFDGIRMVITAFVNEAVGKLYGAMPSDQVDQLLEICDVPEAFQISIDKSVEWSKAFFADPEKMQRALLEEFDNDE